jgi:transcriptional regulator with XRE-family HTH domain
VPDPRSETQLRLVTEEAAADAPSVYFSGALTWYAKSQPASLGRVMEIAETVESCLQQAGMTVHIPHRDVDHSAGDRTYWQNRGTIARSDLVVAYYDLPSTGMGQELEIASAYARPVILLIDERRAKISTMVTSAYFQSEHLIYDNLSQLADALPPMARELIDRAPDVDPLTHTSGSLGDRLTRRRTELGMSRATLADRAGCSTEMIRHLEEDEQDVVSPTLAQLQAISVTLGSKVDDLLGLGVGPSLEHQVFEFAARTGRSAGQAMDVLGIAARGLELGSDSDIARLFEALDSVDED